MLEKRDHVDIKEWDAVDMTLDDAPADVKIAFLQVELESRTVHPPVPVSGGARSCLATRVSPSNSHTSTSSGTR